MDEVWKTEIENEIDLWDTGQDSVFIRKNRFGVEFKIGDKVIIKPWNKEFEYQSPSYAPEMRRYENKIVTIEHFDSSEYEYCYLDGQKDIDDYTWNIDWLTKPQQLPDELFDI